MSLIILIWLQAPSGSRSPLLPTPHPTVPQIWDSTVGWKLHSNQSFLPREVKYGALWLAHSGITDPTVKIKLNCQSGFHQRSVHVNTTCCCSPWNVLQSVIICQCSSVDSLPPSLAVYTFTVCPAFPEPVSLDTIQWMADKSVFIWPMYDWLVSMLVSRAAASWSGHSCIKTACIILGPGLRHANGCKFPSELLHPAARSYSDKMISMLIAPFWTSSTSQIWLWSTQEPSQTLWKDQATKPVFVTENLRVENPSCDQGLYSNKLVTKWP